MCALFAQEEENTGMRSGGVVPGGGAYPAGPANSGLGPGFGPGLGPGLGPGFGPGPGGGMPGSAAPPAPAAAGAVPPPPPLPGECDVVVLQASGGRSVEIRGRAHM